MTAKRARRPLAVVPDDTPRRPADVQPIRPPHRWPCGHRLHWMSQAPAKPLPNGDLWTINATVPAPEGCPRCAETGPPAAPVAPIPATPGPGPAVVEHQADDDSPANRLPPVPAPRPQRPPAAPGTSPPDADRYTQLAEWRAPSEQRRDDRAQRAARERARARRQLTLGLAALAILAALIVAALVALSVIFHPGPATPAPVPSPVVSTVPPATVPQSGSKGASGDVFVFVVVAVTAGFVAHSLTKGRRSGPG